jgi:hypothetical protein
VGKVKACDLDTGDDSHHATFPFSSATDPVDRLTTVEADFAAGGSSDCEVPEFWLDMCSDISTTSSTGHLDLRRNPERWTGYNGSKVWASIYEENCFSKGGMSDMCYEVWLSLCLHSHVPCLVIAFCNCAFDCFHE